MHSLPEWRLLFSSHDENSSLPDRQKHDHRNTALVQSPSLSAFAVLPVYPWKTHVQHIEECILVGKWWKNPHPRVDFGRLELIDWFPLEAIALGRILSEGPVVCGEETRLLGLYDDEVKVALPVRPKHVTHSSVDNFKWAVKESIHSKVNFLVPCGIQLYNLV